MKFPEDQEKARLAYELSQANSRLRTILRSVDSAILLVDTDCRIVFANARVRDLLGIDPDEIIGRDKREVVATQMKSRFRHAAEFESRLLWLNGHMDVEVVDELEMAGGALVDSGPVRWLKRYSAPVRDENGALLGRISVYTDITEERRTQEILEEMVFARTRELQEMNQQLVQRERLAAIGELAASVAHELRNPLGIVSNATYLLRRKLGADPSVSKTLETLETHVHRCSRVINDLLDFARLRPLHLQPVDPCSVMRNALREHVVPQNIHAVLEFSDDVQPITGDPQFLEQAISNLIANALQAMSDTKQEVGAVREPPLLRLTCRAAPGGIELAVADQGAGMTQEVQARIFEPLFTTSPQGTGLGLPLVKRIIEAHEGRLTVETSPGAGTTFTLFLPSHSAEAGRGERH